ncbi:family 10 glycosylhydrolase [Konateibacter massiliensis]|uniref:family 10 glycosylhydrolase n=1 Tax=Konateibacter massiliensis TaxID=2002841 RepID=UPI000C14AB65|nr:family 10 glycosylhydrolase [Konateibacter massiliensis]
MNKRIIAIIITAVMLFPNVSMTALASGDMPEVQGSYTSTYDLPGDIEAGDYTIEENSTVIENTESEVAVEGENNEEKKADSEETNEEKKADSEETNEEIVEETQPDTTVTSQGQTGENAGDKQTEDGGTDSSTGGTEGTKDQTVPEQPPIVYPGKISSLTAKVQNITVSLTWKKAENAESYVIYRSTSKNSGFEEIGGTTKLKYTDKTAVQGKSYYYRVCAKGNGVFGEGVTTSKASKIPLGPKGVKSLKYKAETYNTINLSWKASKGATKYVIYRSTSKEGTYKKVKTTTGTTYRQTKVKCGQVYYYKIVPYSDKIPGTAKIIKAYTKPNAVTNLKASISKENVKLTWKKSKGAASYVIYRSTKKNSGFTQIGESKSAKYTDTGMSDGKTYYYRVYSLSNGTKGKAVLVKIKVPKKNTADLSQEMRAVWISYLDYGTLKDKSKSEFTKNINAMYDAALAQNLNTVIVHVRAFSDAVYPSEYYGWANFISSSDDGPSYDPLEIMVTEAHKKGLLFQAWINPYRTADGGRVNPASTSAIKKIVGGVEEIVKNYDVDGIHFDDYFYLSTDSTSQSKKMENVNLMIRQVYDKIKSIDSNVIFGISPAGNVEYAKSIGCDVETWLSETGYIDYICPQLYWSDDYVTASGVSSKMFTNTMKQWAALNKNGTAMYAGLALYKVGAPVTSVWGDDLGWGSSASNLYNQYKAAKNAGYKGYSLYRYESFGLPAAKTELANLKKLSK